MNHAASIAVLSFLTAVLCASPAHARDRVTSPGFSADPAALSQVRGGARLADRPLDLSRTPGAVSVITASDISRSGARTLSEVISRELGVVQYDEIGNSFQTVTDLRGFNASPTPATAVMVDGVRVNEASFGQVNYHLIPLETIERIEIHRGPSTLSGKNAMAGAIHITTKRAKNDTVAETGLSYGSHNRRKGYVQIGGGASGFDYHLSASQERDSGYRRHSQATLDTVSLKLGRRYGDESDITMSYTRVDDRLEQPGSLTGAEIAFDRAQNVSETTYDSVMDFLTVNQRQALPGDFSLALSGHLRERQEHAPLQRGRSSVSEYLTKQKTRGLTGQLSREDYLLGRGIVSIMGAESVENRADSKSVGSWSGWPFASHSLAMENSEGLFAQGTAELIPEALALTAGLRYEESKTSYVDQKAPSKSGSQAFHRTSPRLGLNYNHSSGWGAYLQYAEAFRTPTVNEISSLGPFGQNALRPVQSKNHELGVRGPLSEEASFESSLFLTDVEDDIYPVFDATAGYGKNINLERTRRMGVEWGVKTESAFYEASLKHAFTRSTFETDFSLDKAPWPAVQRVEKGDRIPLVPEHRLILAAALKPAAGLRLTAGALCNDSSRLIGDESNVEQKLPAFCTLDAGASYERAGWRVYLNTANMLDHRYKTRGILATNPANSRKDAFFVPAPGFSVTAGVSYRFATGAVSEKTAVHERSLGAAR